jgi:hypothetical protein
MMPAAISRRPYSRIKPVRCFETPVMLAIARGARSSAAPSPILNQPNPFASFFALAEGKPGFRSASLFPKDDDVR